MSERAQEEATSATGTEPARIDRLYTLDEAAQTLGTSPRFPRRLVAERRIRFVKVGRFVRIPESAIAEFVDAGTVEVVARRRGWRAS